MKKLLTRSHLAEICVTSNRTIKRMDESGKLPPGVRVGSGRGQLRYREDDIQLWLELGCPSRDEFVILKKDVKKTKRQS